MASLFECKYVTADGKGKILPCARNYTHLSSLRDHIIMTHHCVYDVASESGFSFPAKDELIRSLRYTLGRHGSNVNNIGSRIAKIETDYEDFKRRFEADVKLLRGARSETFSSSSGPLRSVVVIAEKKPVEKRDEKERHPQKSRKVTAEPERDTPLLTADEVGQRRERSTSKENKSKRKKTSTPSREIGPLPCVVLELENEITPTLQPCLVSEQVSVSGCQPRPGQVALKVPTTGGRAVTSGATTGSEAGTLVEHFSAIGSDLDLSTSSSSSLSLPTTRSMVAEAATEAATAWLHSEDFRRWLEQSYPPGPCQFCPRSATMCRSCVRQGLERKFE